MGGSSQYYALFQTLYVDYAMQPSQQQYGMKTSLTVFCSYGD